jgi:hypothetical protein
VRPALLVAPPPRLQRALLAQVRSGARQAEAPASTPRLVALLRLALCVLAVGVAVIAQALAEQGFDALQIPRLTAALLDGLAVLQASPLPSAVQDAASALLDAWYWLPAVPLLFAIAWLSERLPRRSSADATL